jgi:hypothetical protein
MFDNRRYRDGVRFKYRCEECTCTKGSVNCIATRCLPVTCRHPVSDGCCQTCTDCIYNGKKYRNAARFPDPDDPCQECSCQVSIVSSTLNVSIYSENRRGIYFRYIFQSRS